MSQGDGKMSGSADSGHWSVWSWCQFVCWFVIINF